jgi:hypothetical protein
MKIGDIFEFETPKGKAYLHFIYKDKVTGYLVRVLSGLYSERPTDLEELVTFKERYMVFFPLSAANKQKIIQKIGHYPVDKFEKPKYMRVEHIVRGEFLGWHIVDTDTWERQLVKELLPEQKLLSPWGIWNDTLLIENLVDDWSLEKWS